MAVVPLRRKLFLLAAVAIAPLMVISGISLLTLARQQRSQAERVGVEITRALSTAVDFELHRSISVLETLAASSWLDADLLEPFRRHAKRTLGNQPSWEAVLVADRSGRVVLDTRAEAATPLGAEEPRDPFLRVVHGGTPQVDELRRDPSGAFHVRICVPVRREGEIRWILAALVRPDAIVDLVERQRLPDDWVVSVFDARGLRVARSRRHLEYLGTPASPSLAELMRSGGATGSGVTHALEGDRVYTAYNRLEESGWSVAIGIPPSIAEAGERRSLGVFGGGILLSITVGAIAALRVARTIARPIGSLREAAQALGRRRRVAAPTTSIEEIREVADALVDAAEERMRSEREREDLLARERAARASAEAASRAKDEFLAMLGHELRNPMGAIANATQVLDHPDVDGAAAKRAREIIRRQTAHLARLMDDLLDAGRAILGKIVLSREPTELAAAVGRAVATLRAAGQLDAHRLVQDLDPVWVNADPTRLEQIATNLLTNAVRYTPEGKGIRVSVREESGEAVLRVADEGIGMSSDLIARAFDLFEQGEQPLDRGRGGLGIGLTLVRRLSELQGGSAVAESAGPGKGSEVIVRLPAIEAPTEPRPPERGREIGSQAEVLLVEDNEDSRSAMCDLLELAGHRVRVAVDGREGLAEALAFRPDVCLIDIGLPGLDGYEVARRIRAADDGRWKPVLVAVTGYGQLGDRERAKVAGFDAQLVKPVDGSTLGDLVDRAIVQRRGDPPASVAGS